MLRSNILVISRFSLYKLRSFENHNNFLNNLSRFDNKLSFSTKKETININFEKSNTINEEKILQNDDTPPETLAFLLKYNTVTKNDENIKNAYTNGFLEILEYLVGTCENVKNNDNYIYKLLKEGNYLKILEYLVILGADLSINNKCVLKWACKEKKIEVVKFLLIKLYQNSMVRNDDMEALELAFENNHLEIVQLLIDNDSNIKSKNNQDSITTIKNKYWIVVNYLISKGFDIQINQKNISDEKDYYADHSPPHIRDNY